LAISIFRSSDINGLVNEILLLLLRMETYKELGILPEDGIDLQETDHHYLLERTC